MVWQLRGRCNEVGTEMFFPEKGMSSNSKTIRSLLRVCAECPVKDECLEAALAFEGDAPRDMRHGIWGGTTPGQRHRMVKGPRKPRRVRQDNLCPKGLHEMTSENVYVHPSSGYRECHSCKLDRRRAYEQRRAG